MWPQPDQGIFRTACVGWQKTELDPRVDDAWRRIKKGGDLLDVHALRVPQHVFSTATRLLHLERLVPKDRLGSLAYLTHLRVHPLFLLLN